MTTQTYSKDQSAEILRQLGGRRFIAMTGTKDFLYSTNDNGTTSLKMHLSRNRSGANTLEITLEASDTYTVYFYKGRLCKKTFEYKVTKEQKFTDVYCDKLQSIFTEVTGLYTKL